MGEDIMGKIALLGEDTINKIAAGEVIDRPASVVKELMENSIDAEATSITVEVKNGGKALISVIDNGFGIMREDIPYLFERHATSKIKTIDDLNEIYTLGFRGEAMSSIAAVADIELESQSDEDILGTRIVIHSGKVIEKKEISTSIGTVIKVKNLFHSIPARLKFLKSDKTELNYITDIVEKIALSNTHIAVKYIVDDDIIFHTPGNGDLLSVIQCIYGIKSAKLMLPVNYSNDLLSIKGYISKPEFNKGNSKHILFSINGRIVKNNLLKEAARTAYKTLLMNKRYPITILNICIDPEKIDVNVHPTKAEVKFADDRSIFNLVYHSIYQTLSNNNLIYEGNFDDNNAINLNEHSLEKTIIMNNKGNRAYSLFEKDELSYQSINYDQSNYDYNVQEKNNSIIVGDKSYTKKSSKEIIKGKVIGQVFDTYIVYQTEDSFFIIDQHAAHERILYEELIDNTKNRSIEKQPLLMPIIIELTPKEKYIIDRYKNVLFDLGFDLEFFGEKSLAIRQVPIIKGEPCSGFMITSLLDTIENYKNDLTSIYDKTIIELACKTAIKANNNLTEKEAEELIIQLFNSKQPYTCPHGRPTMISFTRNELEKKFKRIV